MNRIASRLLLAVVLCQLAFARNFPLAATQAVPAARGDLEVKSDDNGNTKLKMKAEFLAPPNSLTPPAQGYVIWLQERGGNPNSAGQLKVEKNRKASFETVTPFKNFDFFVTAEQLTYDEAAFDKRLRIPSEAPGLLRKFGGVLGTIDPFNEKTTEACLQDFVVAEGISHAQIVHALRVAITGKGAGFGLFESLAILGRNECVLRIERALARLP